LFIIFRKLLQLVTSDERYYSVKRLLPFPRLRLFQPARQWGRSILLSIIVGILSGLAAVFLEALLEFGSEHIIGQFTHLGGPQLFDFQWGILFLPAIGGLLSGLLILWLSPQSSEQGTDIFTRAFHHAGGILKLKGPLSKAFGAVCTIACGGSAGPEGPIAGLGSALGSSVGQWFRVTPRESRTLLIAGCAAGVGAIFQCPLGGALFAAEILYSEAEMETQSLMSALVASVISYSTFMAFWGYGEPMMEGTQALTFARVIELPPYALLGLTAGLVGMLFYRFHHWMHLIVKGGYVPRWMYPMLGGLMVGAIAIAVPQVMDSRYHVIQNLLDGSFFTMDTSHQWYWWGFFLLIILLAKCLATVLTVGSGASGGILGPIVFIGAILGATVGAFLETATPGLMTENLRSALVPVGIAGVLSATMRIPLASIVMVSEMTGSYGLLVPLMLVSVTAYLVSRGFSLNSEQLASAVDSPAHAGDAMVSLLSAWRVKDVMVQEWEEVCRPSSTLGEILGSIQPGTRPHFAVLKDNKLVGMISTSDVRAAMSLPALTHIVVAADFMSPQPVAIHPDDDLYAVLQKFKDYNVEALAVVSDDESESFLSMLSRSEIHQAVRKHLLERRQHVMKEHEGIAAMAHDEQMHLLLSDFPVTSGNAFQRCPVPTEAIGHTMQEVNFRERFKLQVFAVLSESGAVQAPPDPDHVLREDDALIVLEDRRAE
jgi:chloride channel protein, CIC family